MRTIKKSGLSRITRLRDNGTARGNWSAAIVVEWHMGTDAMFHIVHFVLGTAKQSTNTTGNRMPHRARIMHRKVTERRSIRGECAPCTHPFFTDLVA